MIKKHIYFLTIPLLGIGIGITPTFHTSNFIYRELYALIAYLILAIFGIFHSKTLEAKQRFKQATKALYFPFIFLIIAMLFLIIDIWG